MKKKWFYAGIFLIVIILVGWISFDFLSSQYTKFVYSDYVNNNTIDLSPDNPAEKFSLLNKDIEENKIFFLGETHGVKENYEFDLALFKYINSRTNLSYYLAENGYAQAKLINRYIKTGNEDILEKVMTNLKGTYAYNKSYYNQLQDLHHYYQSLPEEEKFEYLGIDIEHQRPSAIWYMNTILPEKKIPQEIVPIINQLKKVYKNKEYDSETIKNLTENITKSINKYENIYKSYFGDSFWEFEFVNQNIKNVYQIYNSDNFNQQRDKAIYSNFKKIYPHLEAGKFYGMWGDAHTYQKRYRDIDFVASYLNKTKDFKDNILSIRIQYLDSNRMVRKPYASKKYNSVDPLNLTNSLQLNSNLGILKMDKENSPFHKNDIILSRSFLDFFTNSTTDYVQYLVFLKNGNPTVPYSQ